MKYAHLPEDERGDWLLYKHYGAKPARQRLLARYCEKYDHLACWVYRRMQHRFPAHDPDDGVQAARWFLVDAVDHYNIDHPKAPKFSTFATHHIRLKLLNYMHRVIGKRGPELHPLAFEDLLAADYEESAVGLPVAPEETERRAVSEATVHDLVARARSAMTEPEFTCFQLRFLSERPVRSVQEALGVSYLEARRLIDTVHAKVRPLAEAVGLGEGL